MWSGNYISQKDRIRKGQRGFYGDLESGGAFKGITELIE